MKTSLVVFLNNIQIKRGSRNVNLCRFLIKVKYAILLLKKINFVRTYLYIFFYRNTNFIIF